MGAFLKFVAFLASKGTKYVKWAWANKGRIIDWLNIGMAFEWIFQKIKQIIG